MREQIGLDGAHMSNDVVVQPTDLAKRATEKVVINTSCGRLNIKKHIIDTDIDANDATKKATYHIYLAERGKNTEPNFLFSEHEILLGNILIAAEEIRHHEFWFDDIRTVTFCSSADKFISYEVKEQMNRKDDDGERIGKRGAFLRLREVNHYQVYKVVNMYSEKSFTNLTKEELHALFDEYILNGYEIDANLYKIFLAGLVTREITPTLMKYVPHGIIIKNPKTGVSSISMRVGQNIDQASFKTLEGFADAEGNMYYSPLHNTIEHLNFDEVLFMPDLIIQRIFSYMEGGRFKTLKGGRTIDNVGCARLTFTINPPEMERKRDGSISDYAPYVFERFKNVISKLTNSSSAALSRFGFVIFDINMMAAKRVHVREEEEEYEKISMLAKEILKYMTPVFTKYIKKNERWLNKPIEEYNQKIDHLLQKTDSKLMKEMWDGQKNAFRHMRGYALFLSMMINVYELLRERLGNDEFLPDGDPWYQQKEEEVVDMLISTADEELVYICERNLQTLRNLLEVSTVHSAETIKISLETIQPEYMRAILHAYGECNDSPKEFLTLDDLKQGFHKIPDEQRATLFGSCSYWSRVEQKMKLERLQKLLDETCEITMEFTDGWVFKRNKLFMDAYLEYKKTRKQPVDSVTIETEVVKDVKKEKDTDSIIRTGNFVAETVQFD